MRAEHEATRQRIGLFDVSHMGEFRVVGPGAEAALERVLTNRVADLAPGQARYNIICNQAGGVVDDALLYRHGPDTFVMVVNAATREPDFEHLSRLIGGDCRLEDQTTDIALLAVQGPQAASMLQSLASLDLSQVRYYHFHDGRLGDLDAGFSRTGYTGEDGFELFLQSEDATTAWDMLLEAGAYGGILPCGLGARDTLRLEAAMRLSGQDIDLTTNPLEAGLGWAVKLDKGEFVGRDALEEVARTGPTRSLIGLELEGRAIARHGMEIRDGGRPVGTVTSGTFSFTLGRAVAMGYVEAASLDSDKLTVVVRDSPVAAGRVPLPFYKRQRT
jgi:aminomethyltransferase